MKTTPATAGSENQKGNRSMNWIDFFQPDLVKWAKKNIDEEIIAVTDIDEVWVYTLRSDGFGKNFFYNAALTTFLNSIDFVE